MTDDPPTIECPVDECPAGPWPDTYGYDGGRRARVQHVLAEHEDDIRGNPIQRLLRERED